MSGTNSAATTLKKAKNIATATIKNTSGSMNKPNTSLNTNRRI